MAQRKAPNDQVEEEVPSANTAPIGVEVQMWAYEPFSSSYRSRKAVMATRT